MEFLLKTSFTQPKSYACLVIQCSVMGISHTIFKEFPRGSVFRKVLLFQLKELPTDTPDSPWKMSEEEIGSRCDLRDSRLIFSIDPKGCEDVDDTLSVRCRSRGGD